MEKRPENLDSSTESASTPPAASPPSDGIANADGIDTTNRAPIAQPEDFQVVVYDQLRSLARTMMSRERVGQTLQATALVHEAYVRLSAEDPSRWRDRHHFYIVAAQAMRRILVEQARRKGRTKHGGDMHRVPLLEDELVSLPQITDLVSLDDAIRRFALIDQRAAHLVTLRYFAGLSLEEAAKTLEVSLATAKRDWKYARAWLFRAMSEDDEQDGAPHEEQIE